MTTPTNIDRRQRVRRSLTALLSVFMVGVVGFMIIGAPQTSFVDALYMTTITLTTVGYGEVVAVTGNPAAQVFTTLLLLSGVSTFLYVFSALTAFILEGTLDRVFWRRKMVRQISRLHDHTIVCGGGQTGTHVVQELLATDRPFVLIERDPERIAELYRNFGVEFASVAGDATDDETLLEAGIARAGGLVSCINSDKDNLVVTFSARALNKDLRIVVRATRFGSLAKLKSAGADSVVSPDHIGGLRMVSEMVRPAVVSFLDLMLRDKERNLRFEEVEVSAGSQLDGTTVGQLRQRKLGDMLVVALRTGPTAFNYNPPDDEVLTPGKAVVFIGSPLAREMAQALGHRGG